MKKFNVETSMEKENSKAKKWECEKPGGGVKY